MVDSTDDQGRDSRITTGAEWSTQETETAIELRDTLEALSGDGWIVHTIVPVSHGGQIYTYVYAWRPRMIARKRAK